MGYYCVRPMYSWNLGRIYYVFQTGSEGIADSLKPRIRAGMDVWEVATDRIIQFIEGRNPAFPPAPPSTVDTYPQTIVIKTGGSNSCDIGLAEMTNNNRKFTCKPDIDDSSILHELGHGLGLVHEHERPDGHLFGVKLVSDIALTVQRRNEGYYGVYATEFDYYSIMLYKRGSSYQVPDFRTAQKFEGKGMGSVTALSTADISTVRRVYGGGHPTQPQPKRPAYVADSSLQKEILTISKSVSVIVDALMQRKIHPRLETAFIDRSLTLPPGATVTVKKTASPREWEIDCKVKVFLIRENKSALIVLS